MRARESVPSSTASRACWALDARLELAHAAGDGAQLLGEHARAALGVRRSVAQLAELAVDARLLGPRIARRRAREQQARDQDGGCGG